MSYGTMYNPPNPYLGPIQGGLAPGKMIRIHGNVPPNAQRFAVNLQCGPGVNPRDDIALHVNFRFPEGCVVRNHLQSMTWGPEETAGGIPLVPSQPFQILLLVEHSGFKIALNGAHFCEFIHRLPYQRITFLTIDGDVTLSMVSFDGGDPGYQQAPPSYTAATTQPSMGFSPMGGAPMGGSPYPPSGMQGMGGPPAYGAPQQYPPNPGYVSQNTALSYGGAPPMGYPQQSQAFGSDSFAGGGMPMMAQQRPKESSMGMKALKYGVPLAGVGLAGYALGGGFSHSDDDKDTPDVADDDDDWLG